MGARHVRSTVAGDHARKAFQFGDEGAMHLVQGGGMRGDRFLGEFVEPPGQGRDVVGAHAPEAPAGLAPPAPAAELVPDPTVGVRGGVALLGVTFFATALFAAFLAGATFFVAFLPAVVDAVPRPDTVAFLPTAPGALFVAVEEPPGVDFFAVVVRELVVFAVFAATREVFAAVALPAEPRAAVFGAVAALDVFAVDFLAVNFFAVDFFAVDFFAVDFFAVDFLAVDFLAVDFLAVDFLAVDFLAVDFFAVDVPTPAAGAADARFAAADFFAADVFLAADVVFVALEPAGALLSSFETFVLSFSMSFSRARPRRFTVRSTSVRTNDAMTLRLRSERCSRSSTVRSTWSAATSPCLTSVRTTRSAPWRVTAVSPVAVSRYFFQALSTAASWPSNWGEHRALPRPEAGGGARTLPPMVIPVRDRLPTRRRAWVNRLLLLTNIVVFVFFEPWAGPLCQQEAFFLKYAAIPAEISAGEPLDAREVAASTTHDCDLRPLPEKSVYLSVVTAMFLHAGWLHLVGNMLFLWIFGDNVEDRFGHLSYLVFYLLSGAVATLAFALPAPGTLSTLVGASGAIAGVLGAYAVMYPRSRVTVIVPPLFFLPFRLPALLVLGVWFALQLTEVRIDPLAGGGVAYLAHVAGFVAGVVLTLATGVRSSAARYP